jgi:hypothetical protein
MLNGLKAFDWLRTYTEGQVYPRHFIRQIFWRMCAVFENLSGSLGMSINQMRGYFKNTREVYNKVGFGARHLCILVDDLR